MNNKSPHILNTSSNLLGISFILLSTIKGLGLPQAGLIDEIASVLVVIFAVSCTLSFISIRTRNDALSNTYENWADAIFLSGLLFITITALLFAFDFSLYS
jgi:cytochrome bd-type quinol oxidase subunit 2